MLNKFWGFFAGSAAGLVVLPAAWANGAYKALNGGSFEEGYLQVLDPVIEKCGEFGDAHHDAINDVLGEAARRAAEDIASDAVKRKL